MKHKNIFFLILTIISHFKAFTQPSYHVSFSFKLFDESGKAIDYDSLCGNYQLLEDNHRIDQTPCTDINLTKDHFYNSFTKMFYWGGTVVYNDLIREFVHKKDTMLIVLAFRPTDKQHFRHQSYTIDSLYFKPGKYYINERDLKKIDFKKAEVNYYNEILNWAINTKKGFSEYEKFPVWIELNALRKKYNIPKNDFEEKTVSQIFKSEENFDFFVRRSTNIDFSKLNEINQKWREVNQDTVIYTRYFKGASCDIPNGHEMKINIKGNTLFFDFGLKNISPDCEREIGVSGIMVDFVLNKKKYPNYKSLQIKLITR